MPKKQKSYVAGRQRRMPKKKRYALLVASTARGNAIGMTELCIAPCPVLREAPPAGEEGKGEDELGLPDTGPYLSNLAVVEVFFFCECRALSYGTIPQ